MGWDNFFSCRSLEFRFCYSQLEIHLKKPIFGSEKISEKSKPFKNYVKGVFSGLGQLLSNESSLKMKNAFYFTLKAVFVLKIFRILPWLFGDVKNAMIIKTRLILKFTTSQPIYVTCCRKKDHPLLRFQTRFDVSNLV